MAITRLHENVPAGTWRIEIEREGSEVTVREGLVEGPLETTREETLPDADAATARIAALVAERSGATAAVDPDPHAARYFAERFEDQLVAEFGVTRGEPSDALLRETEDLLGRPMPTELARHLRFRSSVHLGWCNFGEWRIWPDDPIPVDPTGNTFEQLLGLGWPHALRVVMADLVPVGTFGNGDGYYVWLDVTRPDQAVVARWDHETGEMEPFADHVSSLAELGRLYVANEDREGDTDVLDELARGMRRLQHRVSPSWHYRSVVENSGVEPAYELKSPLMLYWFRSGWVGALIEGKVVEAGRWFKPLTEIHKNQMVWSQVKEYRSSLLPSRALYWLFTAYFFDKPELGEVIALARTSPARVVRDAADTFARLQAGDTHVGKLDFAEARRRFLELDLDPARAEARAREAAEAEARKAAQDEADRQAATAFVATASVAQLADELWRRIDQPVFARVVADALAARDPGAAVADRRAQRITPPQQGWDAALEALAASRRPEERALLALVLANVRWNTVGDVVGALTDAERARVVADAPGLVADLERWTRAKWAKESVVAARFGLGLLSAAELEALAARFRWEEDERRKRTEDLVPAGGPVDGSAFGERIVGDAVLAPAPAEAEPEPEPEAEPEAEAEPDEAGEAGEADEAETDEEEDDEEEDDEEEAEDEDEAEEDEQAEEPAQPQVAKVVIQVGAETPELDPVTALVETPAYLRSITDKAPLRRVIEALARSGSPAALTLIRSVLDQGPSDVKTPALLALADVPGDEARELLEARLDTADRRLALYALARRGDPAALPAVEAVLDRLGGLPHLVVFERAMREALRGAAGRPVDVEVLRLALRTVMDNKYAASELHRTALATLGRHAEPDTVVAEALPFVDAEQPEVRAAALAALGAAGRPVDPVIWDDAAIDALVAERGLDGLRAALTDPRSVHVDRLIGWAADHGHLAELEPEVLAVVEARADLPFYTLGYARDGYDALRKMIDHVGKLATPAADALLHRLRNAASPLLRKPFEYARDLNARLDALGAQAPASILDALAGRDLRAVDAFEVGAPKFALGCQVHGIAFTADRIVVVGGGAAAVYDRQGLRQPDSAKLGQGWAYDVDHHAVAGVVVVGYSHGHCQVFDARTFDRRADLSHGGAGVRKLEISPDGRWLATACDDQTLRVWDLATLESVRVHTEPYDVNAVGWLDDDHLLFGTDQHAGILPRVGGEPRRVPTGGVAEAIVVEEGLLIGARRQGLALFDPATLEPEWALPITDVARARFTADRTAVVVGCYGGEHRGVTRWDLATGACEPVLVETVYGLEVDPIDGRILVGGSSGRVTVLDPDGRAPAEVAPAPGDDGTRWMVPQPAVDAVAELVRVGDDGLVVLDAGGRVVRHRLGEGLARVLAAPPGVLPRAAETVTDVPDGVVVAAFGAIVRYGGGAPWSRATDRCEQVLGLGDVVLAASGKHLGWLDAATGEVLDEQPAGVTSSWVEWILPVDRSSAVVAGYDDPMIRLWSTRERRVLAEHRVRHFHDDGRSARPYGMTVHRPSRTLVVSFWDNEVDLIALEGDRFEVRRTLVLNSPVAWVGLTDDARTLVAGHESAVMGFDAASGAPRWRWESDRKLAALAVLGGGRVAVGGEDGSIRVLTPR